MLEWIRHRDLAAQSPGLRVHLLYESRPETIQWVNKNETSRKVGRRSDGGASHDSVYCKSLSTRRRPTPTPVSPIIGNFDSFNRISGKVALKETISFETFP